MNDEVFIEVDGKASRLVKAESLEYQALKWCIDRAKFYILMQFHGVYGTAV